ncbi:MAG TPA: serine/threonine-protein kinase [Planctomycetota bacterium]|nr:serine/threonine-protein kinase [Planctomycetota bacterium]
MSLLQEGQIIRGTWEIERKLGEGAFAEVFRVRHQIFGRQAMKVFKTVGMTLEKTKALLSEAAILSSLSHRNVIRVFEANTTETSAGICGFFTMELVSGGSLDDFWRSHGNSFMPVPDAVEVVRQVCRGLAIAHGQNPPIIHRDIKPQNILVGYDSEGLHVRVSDFGLAKQVNPLTLRASARGTPAFKAPEVFTERGQDSCLCDVWAVGTTLYLLLSDRFPYAESPDEDLSDPRRFKRELLRPSKVNALVDAELDRIASKCLAMNPKDRYPTARELLLDLEKWRPKAARPSRGEPSAPDVSKAALGDYTPADAGKAEAMAKEAVRLARSLGNLAEAAGLLECALNECPPPPRKVRKDAEELAAWSRHVTAPATDNPRRR